MNSKLLTLKMTIGRTKTMICFLSSFILLSGVLLGASIAASSAPPVNPEKIPYPLPPLGSVGRNGMLRFEDIKKLSSPMTDAVKVLRAKNYNEAQTAFQKIQRSRPQEALAYEGEIEAVQRLGTLNATVDRYRKLVTSAESEKGEGINHDVRLAVLHWALGLALMIHNGYYPKSLVGLAQDIGPEPLQQFQEALRLDPDLLVAHLSLASYYDHHSQYQGALARLEYQEALHLRPDLYQLRYLHAASWELPFQLLNEAQLRAAGDVIPEGKIRRPDKAMAEYLALIKDHPNYAPPYYSLGDDYWFIDKSKSKFYWEKYLELGNKESEAWKRVKSTVDAMNERHS